MTNNNNSSNIKQITDEAEKEKLWNLRQLLKKNKKKKDIISKRLDEK